MRHYWMIGLIPFLLACESKIELKSGDQPYLLIENGKFSVDAVVIRSDTTWDGMPMGSGTLSFDYSGELTGKYDISGSLVRSQKNKDGVGALIAVIFDISFQIYQEGLSLIGFRPKGNGKADVFILATKRDVALDSLKAGDVYGIGSFAPFNGLFFVGLDIDEFWAGEKNFLQIADSAFVLTAGQIAIQSRDSTKIVGSFVGTTDISRTGKPLISRME